MSQELSQGSLPRSVNDSPSIRCNAACSLSSFYQPPDGIVGSHLYEATHRMHLGLGTLDDMNLQRSLSRLHGDSVTIGSGFTGSGVFEKAASALSSYYAHVRDINIDVDIRFQCESGPLERAFEAAHFDDVEARFKDMAELSKLKAYDTISGEHVFVGKVKIFVAGFTCIDKSSLNVNAPEFINGVQERRGTTGEHFGLVDDFLDVHRPDIVVLENLYKMLQEPTKKKGVDEKNNGKDEHGEPDISDGEYVVQRLRSKGYASDVFKIEATSKGSHMSKNRLFFVGFHGKLKDKQLQIFTSLLSNLRCAPIKLESYIDWNMLSLPEKHSTKQELSDRILDAFTDFGIPHPPQYNTMAGSFLLALKDQTECVRQKAFLVDQLQSFPDTPYSAQWVDLNLSVQFMIKGNPFSDNIPCLTRKSILWGRTKYADGTKSYRIITGYPLLSLIGWGASDTIDDDAIDKTLAASIVGNAFSGFSSMAVLIALFGAMGHDEPSSV